MLMTVIDCSPARYQQHTNATKQFLCSPLKVDVYVWHSQMDAYYIVTSLRCPMIAGKNEKAFILIKKISRLMCRNGAVNVNGERLSGHKCMSSEQQPATEESVFQRADPFCVPGTSVFPSHLQRMIQPIKESLPLWACHLMQIRPTDYQMSTVQYRAVGCIQDSHLCLFVRSAIKCIISH